MGPGAALQIGERCAVEQDFVVEIGGELGTAPVRRTQRPPVNGIQGPADQLALNIALEKALLVFAEQPVAIQAVGQRRETAAGNPGDDVNRVEEPLSLTIPPDHLGVSQRFEDPVRERGGARSAARERQNDDVLLVARIQFPGLKTVSGGRIRMRDRRIDRCRCAATEAEHGGDRRDNEQTQSFQCGEIGPGRTIRSHLLALRPAI